MDKAILYVAILIITLSSCSTAYKTGQTPDDVYYSPGDGVVAAVPTTNNSSYVPPAPNIFYPGISYVNYTPYYGGYIYNNYCNPYYYNYNYPVYTQIYTQPYVNNSPRIVNLNGYKSNYNNSNTLSNYTFFPQTVNTTTAHKDNNVGNRIGTTLQHIFTSPSGYDNSNNNNNPSYNNSPANNYNNNNNSNSDRNYSPTNNNGSGSSGGEISRPARNGR
jgi:hypothetical protein